MPHPALSVQPEADRIIFIRQQFSQFGGAELMLDASSNWYDPLST